MMNAILRRLHSPDVPDLETYVSVEPAFGLLVQALIGPEGGGGEESFDFIVCSPAWIAAQVGEAGYVIGRHHLIMDRFDLALIREVIEDICSRANGDSWSDLAQEISRYGRWEFEDYRG